jgi:hypothetical protein
MTHRREKLKLSSANQMMVVDKTDRDTKREVTVAKSSRPLRSIWFLVVLLVLKTHLQAAVPA